MLRAENLSKRYFRKTGGANHFFAVKGASLALNPGEVTLLAGRSGSGKTTLLNMLAGLLTPDEGKVWLDDIDLYDMDDASFSKLRGECIGMIPQGRSAIETLTMLENILLPRQLCGEEGLAGGKMTPRKAGGLRPNQRFGLRCRSDVEMAEKWLNALGIAHLMNARPAELSGGELRRMAIARALASSAPVILADEPTGDLDDENTGIVLDLLRDAARKEGRAVLLVSHDGEAARIADCLYRMDGGVIKVERENIIP